MRSHHLLALGLLLALSACDTAIPTDPATLLTDARIARQSGDIDKAVDYLERAHAATPGDAIVRVELASSLFEQAELDITDLDRIAEYLREGRGADALVAPAGLAPTAKSGGACPYADDPDATPFDPRDLDEYQQYLDDAEVSERVRELLDPVITDELRPDDALCSGIEGGVLNYDREGALAALRAADPEITDEQIASALAVNALAEAMSTYLFLSEDLADELDWYRLADESLAICPVNVTDEELLALTEEPLAGLGEALFSIDLRAQLLGANEASTELVDEVLALYEDYREDLAPYCPGS